MEELDTIKELSDRAEKTARALVHTLKDKKIKLALAESCTAGLISSMLAGTSGASSVLWGSFVCYTKEAKISMLGLDCRALDEYGLVSGETAAAMAAAAVEKSGANLGAAVTGLAGPDGDGSGVPVGTVWIAATAGEATMAREFKFKGSRNIVRLRAVIEVFESIKTILKGY